MHRSPHRDLLDFDEAPPDDELPGYEPATAPTYDSGDYDTPTHTFHLRQIDRKLALWVPHGPLPASSYKIITRGFRMFSKRPDMEMLSTPQPTSPDYSIATLTFDNDGPLPWRPRAHLTHSDSHGDMVKHHMESRNFADWTAVIRGTTFIWRLEGKPTSLVLSEKNATMIIARFTYSRYGTNATKGAEVGELNIYRDGLSVDRDGVEKIIASLMVCISHFKKMGRQYWNDAPMRATSLTREHLPSHRALSGSVYSDL